MAEATQVSQVRSVAELIPELSDEQRTALAQLFSVFRGAAEDRMKACGNDDDGYYQALGAFYAFSDVVQILGRRWVYLTPVLQDGEHRFLDLVELNPVLAD